MVKQKVKEREIDAEQVFSMLVDIPSGSEADFDLRACVIEATSSLEHDREESPFVRTGGFLAMSLGVEW